MDQKTFIFIGRSGCGKGTQADLLIKHLNETHPERKVVYLQTGREFREFIQRNKYTSKLSKEIYDAGDRQPDFLAVNMWSHFFIKNITGEEDLVIDGTPRSLNEAEILDTAINWMYKIKNPMVIHINVSSDWSRNRLMNRGRMDDTKEDIESRLEWFDKDVMPAIDYYKKNNYYKFIEVDGERDIESVHRDITTLIEK